MWSVIATPTLWLLIASGAIHNFNMYTIGAFLVSVLNRFHGMELAFAGLYASFAYGFVGVPGLLAGGWAADWLRAKRVDGRLIVGGVSVLIAAPLTALGILRPAHDAATMAIVFGIGCGFMYVYYSSVYATLQDVVRPEFRGTAMALYFFAMYTFGACMGPLVTGMVSDHFAQQSAASAGITGIPTSALGPEHTGVGLRDALLLIPVLNVVLAGVLFAGCLTVRRDVERIRSIS